MRETRGKEKRRKEEEVTRSFNFRPWYVRGAVKIKSIGKHERHLLLHPSRPFYFRPVFPFSPSRNNSAAPSFIVQSRHFFLPPPLLLSFPRRKISSGGGKNDKIVGKFGGTLLFHWSGKDSYVVSK